MTFRINESWRSEAEVKEWLTLVKTSSPSLIARFSPFFCSLLIAGASDEIEEERDAMNWSTLSVLVWLVNDRPEVSGRVTLTLLYQLAQEKRPLHQVALLRAITNMGKHEVTISIKNENKFRSGTVLHSKSLLMFPGKHGACFRSFKISIYGRILFFNPCIRSIPACMESTTKSIPLFT